MRSTCHASFSQQHAIDRLQSFIDEVKAVFSGGLSSWCSMCVDSSVRHEGDAGFEL
jgi:hypothetical protein